MGIPSLTKHVRDYGETVCLGEAGVDESIPRVTSVVIDGPSLVFHIYLALRSCSDSSCSALDAQPTCTDVSIGFVQYLVHLLNIGVNIQRIYFDGALPLAKRVTRLKRLEKIRKSFEDFYLSSTGGFKESCTRSNRQITPDCVFTSRATPAKFASISQAAFIVGAVIEDLKGRWTADSILAVFGSTHFSKDAAFDFKGRTSIVLGEADVSCAEFARRNGSSVLTQDSDLLLHDLGDGSIVFLDSLSLTESGGLLAREWRPSSIVKRLGVPSIRRFGFEIYRHPSSTLATIIQRSKSTYDEETSAAFAAFLKEYDARPGPDVQNSHILDPRISELYAQYMLPEFDDASGAPHIYLPMLLEDYTRSTACVQGSDTRLAAYSIFNLSFPPERRKNCVTEYMRRGSRVAAVNVSLLQTDDAIEYAQILLNKVDSIRQACDADCLPIYYWMTFAVSDIFANNPKESMDSRSLERFLMTGCRSGGSLQWRDIHFQAQLQAVLYSVRIFQTLINVALNSLEGELKVVATRCVQYMEYMPPVQATATTRVARPLAAQLAEIVRSVFEGSSAGQESAGVHAQASSKKTQKRRAREVRSGGKQQKSGVIGSKRREKVNVFDILQTD